ncbi:hypothetical protein JCM8547_008460 [Rhodosporidiobolus lusitaniae]
MATTFSRSGAGGVQARTATASSNSAFLRDVLDELDNPNRLPGPPPTHFFPSVPRAQRDKARQARLASLSPSPPLPPPHDAPSPPGPAVPAKDAPLSNQSSSPDPANEDEQTFLLRQRQAKVELASAGPFDNRRPSAISFASSSAQSGGSSEPFPSAPKSVGNGGGAGTKRRHRDSDRTSWDAASELIRVEREKEKAKKRGAEVLESDGERTPTPSVAASFSGPRPVLTICETEGSTSPEVNGRAPSFVSATSGGMDDEESAAGGEEDEVMTLDDASVRSGASGGIKATGADASGKEPAKKRSRTLTTPAQTAVLNALLAKTRFPSTETREEVGKQIGMSARRVQIWFQNRRQSQKRQRDRDAQEAAAATAAGLAHPHQLPHHQPVYQHPYAPHAHIDPYSNPSAQFYPPLQPKTVAAASPYAHLPPATGSRPELHHRVSMDSVASRASFASNPHSQHSGMSSLHARSTQGSERDGLGPLPSDARFAHPYTNGTAYGCNGQYSAHPAGMAQHGGYGFQQRQPAPLIPSKLYFPHVPRAHPHAPPGRVHAAQPAPSIPSAPANGTSGDQFKLPSLSAVLNPTTSSPATPSAQPAPQQPRKLHAPLPVPVSHTPMFSHSPFSPPPEHASIPQTALPPHSTAPSAPVLAPAPAPTVPANRALFSPEPSATSFERLRISSGMFSPPPPASSLASPLSPLSPFGPPSSSTATPATSAAATISSVPEQSNSPMDVLDVAIEAMAYQPSRHLPPRQTLPPLRSILADVPGRKVNKCGKSEADKALLAPIGGGSSSSSSATSAPPRLAPISTFAPLTAPSPPSTGGVTSPLSPSAGPAVQVPASFSSNLRSSTWSDHSAATRSTADFSFAHPPPGSYRDREAGGGWAAQMGGEGGARRGGSGSAATSVRTSVSSAEGGGERK